MKIALFCEDKFNKPFQILTQRIMGKQKGVIMRSKKRHDLLKEDKIYSHITYDILQDHPDISKIIVCVDSECTPEKRVLEDLRRVESSIKTKLRQPIHYLPVTHALEGWLLADPETIKQYLGSRVRVDISSSATSHCKPKELMKEMFQKADREFLPSRDNGRIADQINIDEIAKNNRSFACYRKVVQEP